MDDLKLYEQFQELCLGFPGLSLQRYAEGPWYVRGQLKFSRAYLKQNIEDEYSIEILIPQDYPLVLPKTFETGGRIPRDFHQYQDGSLCLGAPLATKQKFRKQPSLFGYVEGSVIPYLYSYSYKCKFGKLPFGELSHGGKGILEYYQEVFSVRDPRRVRKFLQILADGNYRGHSRCPCGTGKRLRSCHGELLLELMLLQTPAEFHAEEDMIIKYLISTAFKLPYRSMI